MAFDPRTYKPTLSDRDRYVSKYGEFLGNVLGDFIETRNKKEIKSPKTARELKIDELSSLVQREVRKYKEGSRDLYTAVNNIKIMTAELASL